MKRVLFLGALLALGACGDQSGAAAVATTLSPAGADDIGAGYSPDGSRIYWWSRAGEKWQLWESPADMSAPKKVPILASQANPLVWSPDGSRFAIGADIGDRRSPGLGGGHGRRRRRGGSTRREAFQQPIGWNPDGQAARLRHPVRQRRSSPWRSMSIPAPPCAWCRESRGPTVPSGLRTARSWPCRSRTEVSSSSSWPTALGGNLRPLTTEGFESLSGAVTPWSPDGTRLLYTSTRTGAADIWVLPVDGGKPRQLTNDVRDDNSPIWSPDGAVDRLPLRTRSPDRPLGHAGRRRAGGAYHRRRGARAAHRLAAGHAGAGLHHGEDQPDDLGPRPLRWRRAAAHARLRSRPPGSMSRARGRSRSAINRGGGVFDLTVCPLPGARAGRSSRTRGRPARRTGPPTVRSSPSCPTGVARWTSGWWMPPAVRRASSPPGQGRNRILSGAQTARSSTSVPTRTRRGEMSGAWRSRAVRRSQVTTTGRVIGTLYADPSVTTASGHGARRGPRHHRAGAHRGGRLAADRLGQVRPAQWWDRSPATDSVAVNVGGSEGTRWRCCSPLNGGAGRQLLPAGETGSRMVSGRNPAGVRVS